MSTVDLFHAEDAELVSFPAGQRIFREGDPGELMYVVREGEVELHVKGQLVEALGPGGVLGEMALIEHAPRTATATAKTACTLVPIPEKRFTFMVQQTPHFALQIMKVMAERLRRMDARL
jgi:CRP/FNR family cyclic AMP-dependent transcriptional regulator